MKLEKVEVSPNKNVNQNLNYDNFLEAQEEEFTPGCCGGGSEGVVYESHEKNQAFC